MEFSLYSEMIVKGASEDDADEVLANMAMSVEDMMTGSFGYDVYADLGDSNEDDVGFSYDTIEQKLLDSGSSWRLDRYWFLADNVKNAQEIASFIIGEALEEGYEYASTELDLEVDIEVRQAAPVSPASGSEMQPEDIEKLADGASFLEEA